MLDLHYEARDIDQSITSQAKIDEWLAAKTKGLHDIALTQLKRKWGTMQKVLASQSRLEKIMADILLDMETRDRPQGGRGNAMLVSGSPRIHPVRHITSYQPSIAGTGSTLSLPRSPFSALSTSLSMRCCISRSGIIMINSRPTWIIFYPSGGSLAKN